MEEPFRTRTALPKRALLFASAGAAALLLGACGATLIYTGGWRSRYPAAVAQKEAFANDRDWPRTCVDDSPAAIRAGRVCIVGAKGVTPDTVIWGDSHAWAMKRPYRLAFARIGEAAYLTSRDGCPPLPRLRRLMYPNRCRDNADAVLDLIRSKKVKRVIFVAGWGWYFTDVVIVDDQSADDSEAASADAINRQFHAVLVALHRQGVEVFVQDPVPGSRIPPPRALAQQAAYGGVAPEIRWTLGEYVRRNKGYFDMLKRNSGLIAGRIVFWPALCRNGYCDAVSGGKPLYFDGSHPSVSTYDFAAGIIAAALKRH